MAAVRHRLKMPRSRTLMIALAVVGVLFLAGSVVYAQFGRDTAQTQTAVAEGQRDATAAQASTLADQVTAACASGGDAAVKLRAIGACQQAVQVQSAPAVAEAMGPRGPGPSPEEISNAVAAYLVAHPPPAGRAPTVAEVAEAVASYLTVNPPSPGRAPTAGEIAAATETYFESHPPQAGPAGRPPTADEIRAAVNDYMAEHPVPAAERGAQGVGVDAVTAEMRDGSCVLVFTLVDPATSTTSERVVPVASGVCDDGALSPP